MSLRLLLLLSLTVALGLAAADDELDQFLELYESERADVAVMEARFVQTSLAEGDRFVAGGSLLYVNPRRLMFRYDDPALVYLVDDLRVYEYDPELAQVQIMTLEDAPQTEALFLGFERDIDRLEEAYELSYFEPPEGGSHGLRLVPRGAEEAYFAEVRVTFRDETLVPHLVHMLHDDGSEVFIEISESQINVPIEPRETQIWLPENTRIVDEDGPVETVGAGGMAIPDPREPRLPEEDEPAGEAAP